MDRDYAMWFWEHHEPNFVLIPLKGHNVYARTKFSCDSAKRRNARLAAKRQIYAEKNAIIIRRISPQ